MATKRTKQVLSAALAVGLLGSSGVQAQDTQVARTQDVGTGVGALVGAVLGGPPGLIIGAVGGTLMGREAARERQQRAQRQEIDRLQAALDDARMRVKAAPANAAQAGESLQLASAAALAPAAPPGGWGLELNVQFRTASAELEPHYAAQLKALAGLLNDLPGTVLVLEGHADPRGAAPGNLALSRQRLDAVRRQLETAGADRQRLRTRAFGEQRPLFQDQDLESRSFERRVVIRIEPEEVAS